MESSVTEFNGKLARHLEAGQYFEIDVTPVDHPMSFYIILAKDKLNENPNTDIGLRVEVHLDVNGISANNRISGKFGNEFKRKLQLDFAERLATIKINIQISDDWFCVAINGKHALHFEYRDNVRELKAIQIGGHVKLIRRVDHRQVYPSIWPPSMHPGGLSFSNDIPIRFQPGHLMVITGQCYGQSTGEFLIEFNHVYGGGVQPFIFMPRFNERVVVRNSFFPPHYGEEERLGSFPFDFNQRFCLGIACRTNDFAIAVNGSYFCSFAFREPSQCPLATIGGLRAYGIKGMGVKITELDHMQLESAACSDFEAFTKD